MCDRHDFLIKTYHYSTCQLKNLNEYTNLIRSLRNLLPDCKRKIYRFNTANISELCSERSNVNNSIDRRAWGMERLAEIL